MGSVLALTLSILCMGGHTSGGTKFAARVGKTDKLVTGDGKKGSGWVTFNPIAADFLFPRRDNN